MPPALPRPREELLAAIQRLQPVQAQTLQKFLGVSQPTLSRWLKAAESEICRMGRTRGALYARRRTLSEVGSRIPVYRIDEAGDPHSVGTLHLLSTGGAWLDAPKGLGQIFEGLPPFAVEMQPQGYMGRGFNERHPELKLPPDPRYWSNDQVLAALALRGEDCTGDLILGDESLNRYLRTPPQAVSREHYGKLAHTSLSEGAGSSAGGEQPKFAVYSGDRHMLVKFADASMGLAGQRWRDLLTCEHLALRHIQAAGFEAAESRWFDQGDHRFLEVDRFDRIGPRGRRALLSLRSIDGEYVSKDGVTTWTDVARHLLPLQLSEDDYRRIRWLDTFGQLIGNVDRHLGNVSFFLDKQDRFRLAPIYDMLPMVFAPRGAHLPTRDFTPEPRHAHNHDLWAHAADHSLAYWDTLVACEDLSDDFRQRCVTSRDTLATLIADTALP
ncbi:type II toxin-antitoxin system HipA family toxin YjjJ [Vitiosangium sp. GDMCC 1.1324]|uniref:type II toxin-antitoxin system HipA family toxin YjjJ n=1 Tax=Vitiosangium sp. (strain GDMCC 1.1324) TaxID=2138576 RepID=UPI000D3A071E|nr:type II toxin-antitoxin system HipA family toxin YjjJ [Vitiosangium sp. GDMCC 1.1324]PTL79596.1 type II toxin-antitoxin system HipA family toxinoxin YjjJ [Vitiosangium sp. GDMCC 1.1324]